MNLKSPFSHLRSFIAKSPITLVCPVSTKSAGAFFVFALAVLVAGTSQSTASAQAVTYAGSGAVNFGTANVCPSGKTTPAPCSQTYTLTYNVTASGTLGTPKALTSGAPDLDYKLASGSTCTGSVTKGNTCKVNVTFAPITPGQRKGAVEIVDASNKVVATTYIYGGGAGPLVGYNSLSGTLRNIGPTTVSLPNGGIAVDGSGNAFIPYPASEGQDFSYIQELLAVNGSLPANPVVKTISTGNFGPAGYLAIDGAGNLFTPGFELLAAGGYSTVRLIDSVFASPTGIAVDGSGNLFISGYGTKGGVTELFAADGYTTSKAMGNGYSFSSPRGLAIDGSGNVFVTEVNTVEEVLATGGYTTVRVINQPADLAQYLDGLGSIVVDPAGDLIVQSDYLAEFLAVNGVVPLNPVGLLASIGGQVQYQLAFEGNGNILTAEDVSTGLPDGVGSNDNIQAGQVVELQLATPPPLTFASTAVGSTSTDSPQSFQIQNHGTANLDVTSLSVTGPNWSQVAGSGTPPDCATSFSLVSSALCNVSISFEPTEAGPLTGAVKIVDNTLNAPGSSQSGVLSGNGMGTGPAPQITSLSNTYGAPYSVVILYGTGFGATQGSSTVTFNGIPTPHYYWAASKIYVTVPPNATGGNIVVAVNGNASNAVFFTVLPQPAITGISPTSGPVGTVVTISGTNLLDYENRGTVSLNGKPLTILSQSRTALKVAVPSGAVTGVFHVLVKRYRHQHLHLHRHEVTRRSRAWLGGASPPNRPRSREESGKA